MNTNGHHVRRQWATKAAAFLTAAVMAAGMSGCSEDEKAYDISPIFPLSADKCEKYNGEESGEGFGSSCLVTKSDCERAAEDWRVAMRESGVNDAMQFSCG